MEKKFIYEAPEMESILLKLEQGILTDSNQYGGKGAAGGDLEDGNSYEL